MSHTLSARGLTKRFGPILALSRVSLSLSGAEIVAVVGSNGSGKSTFLRILYGVASPDDGTVQVDQATLARGSICQARAAGLEMVFQDKDGEARLFSTLTVLENLFVGREPANLLGLIERRRMHEEVDQLQERYAILLPPLQAEVGGLSGGQQKMVAIARALLSAPRILLMDEPTAALGVSESAIVRAAIRRLKQAGIATILCSHSVDEVMELADRVLALRAGELVAEEPTARLSESALAVLMSR